MCTPKRTLFEIHVGQPFIFIVLESYNNRHESPQWEQTVARSTQVANQCEGLAPWLSCHLLSMNKPKCQWRGPEPKLVLSQGRPDQVTQLRIKPPLLSIYAHNSILYGKFKKVN
jgi:hypothetical protein